MDILTQASDMLYAWQERVPELERGENSRYEGLRVVLISPEELKLPSYVKTEGLKKKGIEYIQTTDLESVMPQLDILYMTRVQRERFFNEEDYLRLKDSYILTLEDPKE